VGTGVVLDVALTKESPLPTTHTLVNTVGVSLLTLRLTQPSPTNLQFLVPQVILGMK
jgi:hypothetical protein